MGLREEARQDLLVVIRFGPNNVETKKQLASVEELCNNSCNTEPLTNENLNSLSSSSYQVEDEVPFDPLRLSVVPRPSLS